jgi:hypothetical protein
LAEIRYKKSTLEWECFYIIQIINICSEQMLC